MDARVELELGSGEHDEVGHAEVRHLLLGGTDEHLMHEQRLAGQLADGEHFAREAAVGAGDAVDQEDAALGQVGHDLLADLLIAADGDGLVDGAPRDALVHVGGIDDEAVLGAAAGVGAGGDGEAAGAGQRSLVALDRHLDELRGACIDGALAVGVRDAVHLELCINCHVCLPMRSLE